MPKLILFLASFALFLLLANASIYRTTVEVDDENPSRERSCQEQIQQQQQLRHCQMYLMQRVQQERWWGGRDNQQQNHFQQCCQQLHQLETRCRCQGLEQAVRRQQQQVRGQEMQELYETASNIPQMCNIQPMQGCRFSSLYSVWRRPRVTDSR